MLTFPAPTEWIQCIENEPGPKGRAALRQELIQCAQKSTFCVQSSLQENVKGVQCYHDIVHNPQCVQCELLAGEMSSFAFHVSWPCMCYASEIFSKIKYVSRAPIHCVVLYWQKKVYFARDSVNPG